MQLTQGVSAGVSLLVKGSLRGHLIRVSWGSFVADSFLCAQVVSIIVVWQPEGWLDVCGLAGSLLQAESAVVSTD